jgi:hypothetical protein
VTIDEILTSKDYGSIMRTLFSCGVHKRINWLLLCTSYLGDSMDAHCLNIEARNALFLFKDIYLLIQFKL